MSKYISSKMACERIGVSIVTLRKYDKEGLIDTIRTPGGKRLYNVDKYLQGKEPVNNEKLNVCYCRVSTHGQKDDLERQINNMMSKYAGYELITDIGSGINFNRPGLEKIIDLAIEGRLNVVVVSYKDRLCRIGYKMIEHILEKYSNAKIVIENDVATSADEEVVQDLLQIITVFGARVNGMRSHKNGGVEIEI